VAWAEEVKPTRILDIYCGAGLFTLALAKRGFPSHGVEVSHEAILCAQESARENGLPSATFRTGKADRIVQRLIREGERFDAAVVDPPRKGLPPFILENLTRLGIREFLYVSCSPATFARDVKILKGLGYFLRSVQPFDMFPQTYHVETVGRFSL
jgi:23S rRNA (uracil1939-C5)-methyltransferase